MSTPTNILQFDLPGLRSLVEVLGEGAYRGLQLAEWIYLRGAKSFDDMGNLPRPLRQQLENGYTFVPPEVTQKLVSSDGTTRYLISFADGVKTEAVALPTKKRLTVCFSTQAGCALGCTFCATGGLGLSRSLLTGEMLGQLSLVAQDYPNMRISNIVAMGQGEPFANYEATLAALRMMNEPRLFGVGARHITVSTAGLIKQIRRFAKEPEQFTLAVSLHSAVQEVRNQLMPGLANQPIDELREALLYYLRTTSRRPSLEYALIKGVNDDAVSLASLLAFCKVPAPGFHVNLIALNVGEATPGEGQGKSASYCRSPEGTVKHFEQGLDAAGISVSRRASRGEEIAAACGQLASTNRAYL